jgi:hypothetical protein
LDFDVENLESNQICKSIADKEKQVVAKEQSPSESGIKLRKKQNTERLDSIRFSMYAIQGLYNAFYTLLSKDIAKILIVNLIVDLSFLNRFIIVH